MNDLENWIYLVTLTVLTAGLVAITALLIRVVVVYWP